MVYEESRPHEDVNQTSFFRPPTEIRDAIYSYLIPKGVYISLQDGKLKLSACVEQEVDGDHDGSERLPLNHNKEIRGTNLFPPSGTFGS